MEGLLSTGPTPSSSLYTLTRVTIQTFSITTPISILEELILCIAPTAVQYGKILPSRLSNTGELNFNIIMFSNRECLVLFIVVFMIPLLPDFLQLMHFPNLLHPSLLPSFHQHWLAKAKVNWLIRGFGQYLTI